MKACFLLAWFCFGCWFSVRSLNSNLADVLKNVPRGTFLQNKKRMSSLRFLNEFEKNYPTLLICLKNVPRGTK